MAKQKKIIDKHLGGIWFIITPTKDSKIYFDEYGNFCHEGTARRVEYKQVLTCEEMKRQYNYFPEWVFNG